MSEVKVAFDNDPVSLPWSPGPLLEEVTTLSEGPLQMMAGALWGLVCFLCVIVAAHNVSGAPTLQGLSTPTNEELSFMKRYGYLPELSERDDVLQLSYTAHSISEAVVRLQAFAGLPQTGILDEETKKLFTRKRCGVKDIENVTRKRRFSVIQGWTNKTLTYRVLNGSRTLSKERVEALWSAALGVWAPHGALHFVKVEHGPANIEVSFETRDHGDGFEFDGPGGVLAHAYYPPTGVIHFDDDEYWIDNADADNLVDEDEDETDFYAVALHELGHLLGLNHSEVESSVMYPWYSGADQLDVDDIMGMHELYMKDEQSNEEPTESNLASPFTKTDDSEEVDAEDDVPDICYTNYDTIQVLQGKVFVFENEWVWVLSRRKVVEEGFPKKFHDVFIGLPQHVDIIRAIYERRNGNIVVFSGRDYWEFSPTFHLRHTGDISDYELPAQVSALSTVFLSNFNNKTYLVDEARFWRFDEQAARMDPKYPKSMAAWRLVPYPVQAALIWDGDTYFFQGDQFWRFDNQLVQAHEYYPLPVAPIWFPCEFRTDLGPKKNNT